MKKIIVFLLLGLILTSCIYTRRYQEKRLAITRDRSIPVSIILYAEEPPDWDKIFDRLNQLAAVFDHRNPANSIWKLNHDYQAVLDNTVLDLLNTAVKIAESSNGAFDPTILPLTSLWNMEDSSLVNSPGSWQVPDEKAVRQARNLVDFRQIAFGNDNTVSLPAGFGIDLGGIAKGAIVDLLADYLDSLGYRNFLIEAGGDLLLSGMKPERDILKPWSLAVKHPRRAGTGLAWLQLGAENRRIAIVTSGDYERFIEINGTRYHHLIDPASGYPAAGNVSVTVIAATCVEADALSTAAFVLGPGPGRRYLENLVGTEGLLVSESDNGLAAGATSGFPVPVEELNL